MSKPKPDQKPSGKVVSIADYLGKKRRLDVATWPGSDRQVAILYLNCEEIQASYRDARAWFDKQAIEADEHSRHVFDQEWSFQQVCRMLYDPDCHNPRPEFRIFKNATQVRQSLSPNHAYHFMQEQMRMSAEEAHGWDPALDLRQRVIDIFDLEDPGNLWGIVEQLEAIRDKMSEHG